MAGLSGEKVEVLSFLCDHLKLVINGSGKNGRCLSKDYLNALRKHEAETGISVKPLCHLAQKNKGNGGSSVAVVPGNITQLSGVEQQSICSSIDQQININFKETKVNKVEYNVDIDYEPKILCCDGGNIDKIVHFGDIHIRSNERHEEYVEVFERVYKRLREMRLTSNFVIVIAGDIIHSRNKLENNMEWICQSFLYELGNIAPTIVINGNHDIYEGRQDHAILKVLCNCIPNVWYIERSGCYIYNNILFGISSLYDGGIVLHDRIVKRDDVSRYVGLGHYLLTDVGFLGSRSVDSSLFSGYDIMLLGDIHEHSRYNNCVYSGSLIQQNHGESRDKGFGVYNVAGGEYEREIVVNSYGHITVVVDSDGNVGNYLEGSFEKNYVRIVLDRKCVGQLSNIKSKIRSDINVVKFSHKFSGDGNGGVVGGVELCDDNVGVTDHNETIVSRLGKHIMGMQQSDVDVTELLRVHEMLSRDLDNEIKYSCWRIANVSFCNMLAYGDDKHYFVDFESGGVNVIGVFGPNYSGKSSFLKIILLGICGALEVNFSRLDADCKSITKNAGSVVSYKTVSYVNNCKQRGNVDVEIVMCGVRYRISRMFSSDVVGVKQSNACNLSVYSKIGNKYEWCNFSGSKTDSDTFIKQNIITSPSMFILCNIYSGTLHTSLLGRTEKDKYNLLYNLFGFGVVDTLRSRASNEEGIISAQETQVSLQLNNYRVKQNTLLMSCNGFNVMDKESELLMLKNVELTLGYEMCILKGNIAQLDAEMINNAKLCGGMAGCDISNVSIDSVREELNGMSYYNNTVIDESNLLYILRKYGHVELLNDKDITGDSSFDSIDLVEYENVVSSYDVGALVAEKKKLEGLKCDMYDCSYSHLDGDDMGLCESSMDIECVNVEIAKLSGVNIEKREYITDELGRIDVEIDKIKCEFGIDVGVDCNVESLLLELGNYGGKRNTVVVDYKYDCECRCKYEKLMSEIRDYRCSIPVMRHVDAKRECRGITFVEWLLNGGSYDVGNDHDMCKIGRLICNGGDVVDGCIRDYSIDREIVKFNDGVDEAVRSNAVRMGMLDNVKVMEAELDVLRAEIVKGLLIKLKYLELIERKKLLEIESGRVEKLIMFRRYGGYLYCKAMERLDEINVKLSNVSVMERGICCKIVRMLHYNKLMNVVGYIDNIVVENSLVERKRVLNCNLESVVTRLRGVCDNIVRINSEISRYNDVMMNVSEYDVKFNELSCELDRLKLSRRVYAAYIKVMREDGVVSSVLRECLKRISCEINVLLCEYCNFSIEFEVDRDMVSILVNKHGSNTVTKVHSLSGFEQFILDIALKANFNTYGYINKSTLFAIDEGLDVIDSEKFSRLDSLLGYLRSKYDIVLLMSHREGVGDFVDRRLEIADGNIIKVT